MADNVNVKPLGSGTPIATDEIGGAHFQRVKVTFGPDGSALDVSSDNPLPVEILGGGASSSVEVTNFPATQNVSVTNASLAVTGAFYPAMQPVSGPLTDAELRAAAVPVSGTVTANTGLSQPLTDAQLRATPVAVSGTFWQATQPVSGTVTANAGSGTFAVSAASLPLPSGAATAAKQPAFGTAGTASSDVLTVQGVASMTALKVDGSAVTQPVSGTVGVSGSVAVTGTFWQATQPVSLSSLPALAAGSAIIGQVGIDQTTPGTTNAVSATGNVASGASDSGNPVKIGAVFNTTPATLTTGQRGDLQISSKGLLRTVLGDGAGGTTNLSEIINSGQDGLANGRNGLITFGLNSLYNGSTWDRQRGMGSNTTTGDTGAKTATGNGATQTNVGNKGVQIVLNLGTVTGTTPTLVLKIQGSVDGGTTWFDIPGATTASLTATGVYGIMVYPGIAVTAGTTTTGTTATANMTLPRTWRVVWTIGGTTPSFTITNIQYNYLLN